MSELTSLPVSQSTAEPASHEHDTVPLSLSMKVLNAIAVIVPFLGLVLGIVFLWGHGFSWVELGLFLGMYIVTGVGITVGYHRLFTHRAFETSRVMQFILAVLGSMAVQGPLMQWVAMHRRHHQHSDQDGDPHSPHLHGGGFLDLVRGAWHAHVGWVFKPDPADLAHYNRDLRQSRTLFPLWVALGLLIPAVLGGVLTGSWMGALFGLIWGGLARIFLVHHITWSVNSVCHIWGRRPYASGDHSRNNFLFGILALGEGWHNNHHAFPTSARHGLRWWQFDLSYCVIRGMALLGLVWKVKVPSKQALTADNA